MNWWKGQAEGRCLFGSNISEVHRGILEILEKLQLGWPKLAPKIEPGFRIRPTSVVTAFLRMRDILVSNTGWQSSFPL